MAKNPNARLIATPEFRMSFAQNLLRARPYMENGKPKGDPKFQIEMLFEEDAMDKFRVLEDGVLSGPRNLAQVVQGIIKAEWPNITLKEEFKVGVNWPIKKGEALARKKASKKGQAYDENNPYHGKRVLSATANENYPPQLSYREGGRAIPVSRDDEKAKQLFAGGNYGIAELNLVPMEVSGTKYVAIYVNGVQFTRTGESFGRRSLLETHGDEIASDLGVDDDAPVAEEIDDDGEIGDNPLD